MEEAEKWLGPNFGYEPYELLLQHSHGILSVVSMSPWSIMLINIMSRVCDSDLKGN